MDWLRRVGAGGSQTASCDEGACSCTQAPLCARTDPDAPTHPRLHASCSNANGSLTTATIRRNMQRIMQNNAAVFRTQETLAEGCKLIDECTDSYQVRLAGQERQGGWLAAVWGGLEWSAGGLLWGWVDETTAPAAQQSRPCSQSALSHSHLCPSAPSAPVPSKT